MMRREQRSGLRIPVSDTEVLFALNPNDREHSLALKALTINVLKVPDTALLELRVVLRARVKKTIDFLI